MALETCSSSMSKPSEEEVAEMDKLMSDGKRNYICSQPQLALDCFVELCEKLAKCYGQESEKCVEAYLYYGKTLLDIARIENGVLGHAIKEAPVFGTETEPEDEGNEKDENTEDDEEITPEKREDIRNDVEHAMREGNLYNESTTDEDHTEEEGTDVETDVTKDVTKDEKDQANKSGDDVKPEKEQKEQKEEKDATASTAEKDGETKSDEVSTTTEDKTETGQIEVDDGIDCDGSDDGDDNDVSNMELAWEMFELTSVICGRQLSEEGTDKISVKTTLAEAKHGLAEISLETERYEDSVTDFNECLKIYQDILEDKNDRLIAEAYYNIALALSFDKKYSEAIVKFESAVKILKARVVYLESKVKECEEKGGKDKAPVELEEWKKEINELNDLIVLDMMAKIEDAQESKKLLDESIKTVKNAASEMFSTLSGVKNSFDDGFDAPLTSDTQQVVHDISNKIRSIKRKSDDETTDVSEKKVKQTTTVESNTTENTAVSMEEK